MTLPSNQTRLSDNEIESIQIAVREAGIRAIHPDRMEAFAEYLVSQFKNNSED